MKNEYVVNVLTEQEAIAEIERLRAQRDAALRLSDPATPLSGDGAYRGIRQTIEERLTAPLEKMKREIIRHIKQLEAAKLN